MKVTRIWADTEGVSHFEDLDIDLLPADYAPPAPAIDVSAPFVVRQAVLSEFSAGWYGDWHPSPRRQLYFNLGGWLEVEVADGEVRQFGPGDIVLVEDVAGTGHTTRVMRDKPSTGVFVHLAEGDEL